MHRLFCGIDIYQHRSYPSNDTPLSCFVESPKRKQLFNTICFTCRELFCRRVQTICAAAHENALQCVFCALRNKRTVPVRRGRRTPKKHPQKTPPKNTPKKHPQKNQKTTSNIHIKTYPLKEHKNKTI